MIEITLDGITKQYLIDKGHANETTLLGRAYMPGGYKHNDREAIRCAVHDQLGLFSLEKHTEISPLQITFYHDGDSRLDADLLCRLMDTKVNCGGRQYVFYGISSDAEEYEEYGQHGLRRWMEIAYQVAE